LRRGLSVALVAAVWIVAPLNLTGLRGQQGLGASAASKVDARVLAETANGGSTDFILVLAEQADLSGAAALPTKQAKGHYVYRALRDMAARTQAPLLKQLDGLGASYHAYYVANLIAVRGDGAAVSALAASPLVARVEADTPEALALPPPQAGPPPGVASPATLEWNIARINADDVWAKGYTGQGVVIADQDTGFQWDHPALKNQYLGWNGVSADHNFHWWDAIHSDISGDSGNPCGFSSPVPCPDQDHGTHTLGIALGDDGAGNQIGVAPGARWIGCRNMDSGVGRPTTYIECFQFFLAPWDLSGNNANPALAPDVISNSWTCPASELCTGDSLLLTVENVRAAGITVAVAAGNAGPGCSTISSEPSFFDAATGVGATDYFDDIASFSSRGPITVDGSQRLKPDLSAPGATIRSSIPSSGYGYLSGTSMATPHVAGAVALMLSARPELSGDVDTIEARLFNGAKHITTSEICGGLPGTSIPNNSFGWGLLDAYAAAIDDLYYFPIMHN
jgi:serine protease AprX